MSEYFIKYRILTYWHGLNETTHNDYSEVQEGNNAKEAIAKILQQYNFSNPNKEIEIISIKEV